MSSPEQGLAARAAEEGVGWLRGWLRGAEAAETEIVGPAPSPIERLHGRWRWHFFLRSASAAALGRAAHALVRGYRLPSGDVRLALDRDPVALL